MVASLLKMAGLEDWPVPDFSTLCRRQKTVGIRIPFRRAGGELNLLVDSTGVKMRGDGEWQVRQPWPEPAEGMAQGPPGHGRGDRGHAWGGVHLQPDRRQPDPSRPAGADPGRPADRHRHGGTVTADGACDTRTCHSAIAGRGGTAFVGAPVPRTGA
jgi:hypothetical protein